MRVLLPLCLASLVGCTGTARVEGFAAPDAQSFLYTAHTNTVMTENDDGEAEALRRDWLADALKAHGMCADGYAVNSRKFVPDSEGPFANGGDIVYAGRCL